MLEIPDSKEHFRVASFDPGLSHLGCTLLSEGPDTDKYNVLESMTIKVKDSNPAYGELRAIHESRFIRHLILRDEILNFLRTHRPHAIIVESNYLGKFANAFSALVECVAIIRGAVYTYDPFIPVYVIDPTTVKLNLGMKRIKGTDKEDVRKALLLLDKINWNGIDPKNLDEHSIDSVAVGYYYFTNIY